LLFTADSNGDKADTAEQCENAQDILEAVVHFFKHPEDLA